MEIDIEIDITDAQIGGAMDDKSASLIFGGDDTGFTLSAKSAERLKDALIEGIQCIEDMIESRKAAEKSKG
jgi:hypothetical protein